MSIISVSNNNKLIKIFSSKSTVKFYDSRNDMLRLTNFLIHALLSSTYVLATSFFIWPFANHGVDHSKARIKLLKWTGVSRSG